MIFMIKSSKNAFTIIELLVAMALLVMMLSLSGLVFNTTVKTHRAASATVDISRHLTALTSQITSDVDGLRKNAPLFIRFEMDTTNNRRFDAIHFFAGGDSQTTREYPVRYDDPDNRNGIIDAADPIRDETIRGTLARIYYGHANSVDLLNDPAKQADFDSFQALSRKAHVLTRDESLTFDLQEIPAVTGNPMYAPFLTTFGLTTYQVGTDPDKRTCLCENGWEFNTITLDNWINALNYKNAGNVLVNANHFIAKCMANDSRPYVNLSDDQTLHLLLAQGVISFSVQCAYGPDDLDGAAVTGFTSGIRWWPSRDPNGDGNPGDSDFAVQGMNSTAFGVHWNLSGGTNVPYWYTVENCQTSQRRFKSTYFPKALKFTFTLRDGNGFFTDGKTFTHIVYLK